MARSPILSCGTRCRQTTSFSCPQERFTRLARVSSLQNSNSGVTRHFVCSITVRKRELHIENAIVVADAGPADFQVQPNQLTAERKLLVSNLHFVFERIDLAPNSSWYLEAERETWLLVLSGSAIAGSFEVATGDALFAQSDRVDIHAGAGGMVGLVAYTGGGPVPHLLQRLTRAGRNRCRTARGDTVPTSLTQAKTAPRMAAWKQSNETPSACGFHRELSSAPLRNRYVYP